METTAIGLGCLLAMAGIVAAVGVLAVLRRRRKDAEEEPLKDTPLSFLAAMSFLCGLAAVSVLVGSSIVSLCGNYAEVLFLSAEEGTILHAVARIVLACSLFPTVAALGFALGARGVIRESKEGLRGKSLYRSGVLLALVTGVFALMGFKGLSEQAAGGRAALATPAEETPRGYLGAEVEPGAIPGQIRVKAVDEGSPAAAAGLRPGEVILAARARTYREGVTLFPGATWTGSKESFEIWIESLRPGDEVVMEVPLPNGIAVRQAILGLHPVSTLTALLRRQSSDDERLAVLRPAAARRKFRVDEVVRICGTFDFDPGKIEAIRACLPGLADPGNAFQLMGTLEFQASKDVVSRLLQNRPPPPPK